VDNNTIHDLFSTTDTDLDRQFIRADIVLGREGVAQAYGQKYFNGEDDSEYKMDVIIFANDKNCIAHLHKFAEDKYNEFNDTYRIRFCSLDERFRNQYDSIVTNGDLVSKHIFTLPEFINVDVQKDGKTYNDHLFLNDKGTATFNLTSWEEKVLEEERKANDFVCWLRNPDRKSWAMCIPYEMDNEFKPMYPDFIIIRKSPLGYLFDILEPHNSSLKDNLPKAKGLARYAQMNIGFTRVQLIRIVGSDIIRLDMGKTAIRNKVISAINNEELDHIFETDGEK
jgi:type III restriction enzyme